MDLDFTAHFTLPDLVTTSFDFTIFANKDNYSDCQIKDPTLPDGFEVEMIAVVQLSSGDWPSNEFPYTVTLPEFV